MPPGLLNTLPVSGDPALAEQVAAAGGALGSISQDELLKLGSSLAVTKYAVDKLRESTSQYDGQIPDLNWETVKTTIQPAFIAAAAGMVEAVMTMEVVNDLTETNNPNPNQQLFALSIGNFASGLLGTMGGGATIGLSMINCTNGANGRYRISGIVAAIAVLVMVLVAAPVIKVIPTASLVGVMVVVCTATFEWSSLPTIGASILPARVR